MQSGQIHWILIGLANYNIDVKRNIGRPRQINKEVNREKV